MVRLSYQRCDSCFIVNVPRNEKPFDVLYHYKTKHMAVGGCRRRVAISAVAAGWDPSQQGSVTAFHQAQVLFEQNCAACHANGGNIIFYARNKTLFPKALEKNGYRDKDSISQITKQGKGAMPGYANKLDDQEISLLSVRIHIHTNTTDGHRGVYFATSSRELEVTSS